MEQSQISTPIHTLLTPFLSPPASIKTAESNANCPHSRITSWIKKPIESALLLSVFFLGFTSEIWAADTGEASSRLIDSNKTESILEDSAKIERVRINVSIQSWNSVASTNSSGKSSVAKVPLKPLNHVLRARIEKPNDFYFSDLRIQTNPIRWIKPTGQYQLKAEIYRRLGESGQIEESIGTMLLSGVLKKQGENLYTFIGSSKRRFLDQSGLPQLDITLGVPNHSSNDPVAISKSATTKQIK
ncbi:MAG: hypothetical protein NT027_11310 [Proteobacteria bacterium]|nr:hypothetical protein [Pseudomonadota bacterium]